MTLTRILFNSPKFTVGYIKYINEVLDSVLAEGGNKHLLAEGEAYRNKISSQRQILVKHELVEELCKLSSITEAVS